MFRDLKCWPTFRVPWENSVELPLTGHMMFIQCFLIVLIIKFTNLSHYDVWLRSRCHTNWTKTFNLLFWTLIVFFKNSTYFHNMHPCVHKCPHLHVRMKHVQANLQSISCSNLPGRLSLIRASTHWYNWGNQLWLAKLGNMEPFNRAEGWPSPWPPHTIIKHSHM